MNIMPFILFGLINGIIINSLEDDKKGSLLGAMSMGILGSITGGMFALLLFGGIQLPKITPSLVSIIIIEAVLLFFLLFGKPLKKI